MAKQLANVQFKTVEEYGRLSDAEKAEYDAAVKDGRIIYNFTAKQLADGYSNLSDENYDKLRRELGSKNSLVYLKSYYQKQNAARVKDVHHLTPAENKKYREAMAMTKAEREAAKIDIDEILKNAEREQEFGRAITGGSPNYSNAPEPYGKIIDKGSKKLRLGTALPIIAAAIAAAVALVVTGGALIPVAIAGVATLAGGLTVGITAATVTSNHHDKKVFDAWRDYLLPPREAKDENERENLDESVAEDMKSLEDEKNKKALRTRLSEEVADDIKSNEQELTNLYDHTGVSIPTQDLEMSTDYYEAAPEDAAKLEEEAGETQQGNEPKYWTDENGVLHASDNFLDDLETPKNESNQNREQTEAPSTNNTNTNNNDLGEELTAN